MYELEFSLLFSLLSLDTWSWQPRGPFPFPFSRAFTFIDTDDTGSIDDARAGHHEQALGPRRDHPEGSVASRASLAAQVLGRIGVDVAMPGSMSW
jgi:hypothetical protein